MGDKKTPGAGWGQTLAIPPGNQLDVPLMDPVLGFGISTGELIVGEFSEAQHSLYISQIQGQFALYYNTEEDVIWRAHMRFWPGLATYDSVTTIVTTVVVGFIGDVLNADAEVWHDRRLAAVGGPESAMEGFHMVDIPGWHMVDVRPKRLLEQHVMPVVSIFNPSDMHTLNFVHWWNVFGGNR